MAMTFEQAARRQYLHHTFYTVFLVSPDGAAEYVAKTQRKSGMGLINVLRMESVQAKIKTLPGIETATFAKHRDRLQFSNGWSLSFGGTIREEASK